MGRTDVDVRSVEDTRPSQYLEFSAITIKKRSIALFLLRLPALIPWIFMVRGWFSLNTQDVLTNTEADVLGSGGEACLLIALSITPIITMTGQQWIAPLRRWYGIMFALIGISDGTTAAITTSFAGGPVGRLAGHSFLLSGLLIVLLLLLDGLTPFQNNGTDGDPVFHQRFYQAVAISIPLFVLRLPPVRRWVIEQRTNGRAWLPCLTLSPLLAFYVIGFIFIINEEFYTGLKVLTMTHL